MTEPTRLLDGDLDDFERSLLRSATRDRGSEQARARALAVWGALGMELLAASAVAGTGASAGLVSGAAVTPAKGTVSAVTASLLAKWLGTGALVGTLTAGGAFAVQGGTFTKSASAPPTTLLPNVAPERAEKQPAPRSAAAPETKAEESETKVARSLGRDPAGGAEPEPTPVVAEPKPGASNVAFPVDSASTLSEELAHLERARRALRAADVTGALRELSRYSARFPKGALADEATLLTVEARLEAGDVGGAHAAAARILDRDRTSPHARRLESLFASKEKR